MKVFHRPVSSRGLAVFGIETMLISGSILVAAAFHGSFDISAGSVWRIVLITVLCELCFYYNDLYDLTLVHSKGELMVRVMRSAGVAAIVIAAVTVVAPALIIGQGVVITSLGLLLVAVPTWRVVFEGLKDPHLEERILILGTGAAARTVARQIRSQHDFAYRIVGFVSDQPAGHADADMLTLGAASDLPDRKSVV